MAEQTDHLPRERLYTVGEIATLLHTSDTNVYRWIKSGLLEAFRIGPKGIRVKQSALDAHLTEIGYNAPAPEPASA